MPQELRDFYEGKHLVNDSAEELKKLKEKEKQMRHDEKIKRRKQK